MKMTVAEYAERWLSERGPAIRERTLHGYRRSFDRELLPNFGQIQLAALSRAHIKEYASRRASKGAAANTIRNALAPLRAMLSTAVEDGYVRENVALRLPRVGAPPRTITPPTREQVERCCGWPAMVRAARSSLRPLRGYDAARCLRCVGAILTSKDG